MANAMILAAGFGTRMRPLSALRPKCLMPVMNRPLLGLWLKRMADWGFERVVVNTHYLADRVRAYLDQAGPWGLEVLISHEPVILGTGGGPVAARPMLGGEPFLLANSDVISTIQAPRLLAGLHAQKALAVLALVDEPRFNTVAVEGPNLLGFKGDSGLPPGADWLTYTGMAALAPGLLDYLPREGESSLVDALRRAMADGEKVLGMRLPGYWDDLGTPERYLSLHRELTQAPPADLGFLASDSPLVLADGAKVSPQARLSGFAVLGEGVVIGDGAGVSDSVLLPGAKVLPGVRVHGAVLGDGYVASSDINGGAHA
jgi:mannose-1-phosphate guanylyltransferase